MSKPTPNSSLVAAINDITCRVQDRVDRGMSRDKALMLTIMEMGGKITIVKG